MGQSEKKRGRPPVDVKQKRSVAIRLDDNTYARMFALAQDDDVSISKIGKIAIQQYLDRRSV